MTNSISKEQRAHMMHALGHMIVSGKPVKSLSECYRNRYCAGGETIERWDDLVGKGFAVLTYMGTNPMYEVTEEGFLLLQKGTEPPDPNT